MIRNVLVGLVLIGLMLPGAAWGQTLVGAATSPHGAGVPGAANSSAPSALPAVLPETPVITIHGLCQESAQAKDAKCETIVTRRDFEDMVNAFQPGMSQLVRNQFATRYAAALVMSEKAHEMGLDESKKFQEKIRLARMQLLMQLLDDELQEKAGNVPESEILNYYSKNPFSFEEADLERIFVPRNKRVLPAKDKVGQGYKEDPPQVAIAEMKKEAEQLRARAAAGEDFARLQAEAFKFANMEEKPPSTEMKKTRRSTLPGSQAIVFDLKQGEVSQVIPNMTGFLIYKLGPKDTIPLDQVRSEIRESLKTQRLKDSIQALRQTAKTELNDNYFSLPDSPMAEPVSSTTPATARPAPAANQSPISTPPAMTPKESSY